MRYLALATDYDNTLAREGRVADSTWAALDRLRQSGRYLVLVTGRELDDLMTVCPRLDMFARVVAENGGILFDPSAGERRLLADAPPKQFVDALRARGLKHFSVSETLVAMMKPNEQIAFEVIRVLGLELHVVFNGDAVMVLQPGITKASGLRAALDALKLSPLNVVGLGDAENDHALIRACGLAVAVENALPALKQQADLVTSHPDGEGVATLIDALIADDLRAHASSLARCRLTVGKRGDVPASPAVTVDTAGSTMLLVGASGSGKSTAAEALLESLTDGGYQLCIFDPEGDYVNDDRLTVVGNAQTMPVGEEVLELLERTTRQVAINMMRVPPGERPQYCAELLLRLQALRARTARPHWLVFDEAHHLFPAAWASAGAAVPQALESTLVVTVHPEQLSPALLKQINIVVAMGDDAADRLGSFASSAGIAPPVARVAGARRGEALFWEPAKEDPYVVTIGGGRSAHRRHVRKYAEGLLIPERSFYFRGPRGQLNLRAHNLVLFVELAEGVDEATWRYHLQRGDYSQWFESVIGDVALANSTRAIEQDTALSPAESRKRVLGEVNRRYTQPENPTLPRPDY
ncbi:HAD hydrolase family protein [Paraburkholderia sp. XV]|uniref:HAD hydrolase family protein n=1 Tax=Paraburkholderia sp. XV TaxID=2831520 RepID=UPI001CD5C0E1|nr:HAD hydrolase family protein [Paraburkholderia sp. XV]